jgi:quinol monooxygenase YgiN
MVLYVIKYNIHPDKTDAFQGWVKVVIPKILAIPGVVEFRAYRPLSGSWQVATTVEFADLAAWTNAANSDAMTKINDELHTLALDINHEIWGPSPAVPTPLRPGK